MPKTVGVAVSNATFHFDKLYTYAVLPEHQNVVRLGSMVLVPFGKGSRARMGVVLACDAEPEHSKLKYLFDVAPASACLTPELLRLVYFLKERTFCTYYEAVKAVIPYGAQLLLAGSIAKLSPLSIAGNNWYCMLLAVAAVFDILFGIPRVRPVRPLA